MGMIVSGYYGELTVTGDLTPRWICWLISMMFFLYIVYELLVGLSAATNSEADPTIKGKIQTAQIMTVISWCTSPIVALDFSSTRSLMQSRTKRLGWLNEIVCASSLLKTSRELFLLHLQSFI